MSFASLVEPEPHDSWSEEESSEERSDSPRLSRKRLMVMRCEGAGVVVVVLAGREYSIYSLLRALRKQDLAAARRRF